MQKVGIKKIGFLKESENDIWEENRTAVDSGDELVEYEPYIFFKSIDQDNSTMEQSYMNDENGPLYSVELTVVVRREDDIALAQEKTCKPQILKVNTADGKEHILGTSDYPVYLKVDDNYNGMLTKELVMKAHYQADSPVLEKTLLTINSDTDDFEDSGDTIESLPGKEVLYGEIDVSNVTSISISCPSVNVNRCVYALLCLLPSYNITPSDLDVEAAWYFHTENGVFSHGRRTYNGQVATGGVSSNASNVIFNVSGAGRCFNGKYKYLTVWEFW